MACGGGSNHRLTLAAVVLLKENHIWAKEWTCPVRVSSSGPWVRTALSRSCSTSQREPGWRRIQPATVRGEGGGAVPVSTERRLVRK
ncbi:hypothetical protein ACFRNJ_29310 [Streptomyces sp. NPDC056721]|uniref:hypothetical protein n=1 Tax=Streptomyces sp. NPDC056721 TaxID=3345923 RepID=UPI0036A8DC7D